MTTRANVLAGIATIYLGSAGSEATTPVGYSSGASVDFTEAHSDIRADQSDWNIKTITTELGATINVTLDEATLANITSCLQGAVQSGSVVTLGQSTNAEVSIKVTGNDPAGNLRIWRADYVRADGNFSYTYEKGTKQMIECAFIVQDNDASDPMTITDGTAYEVAISSGAVSWVSGQIDYWVTSEGATGTDTLTTVTAGAATNGTKIFIHITSGETITVDVLGNIGLADEIVGTVFTMDNVNDLLELTYDGASEWTETGRVKA